MNLGHVLSDWRYMNKLGKQEAAEQIGITASTLSQLEEGKDVTGKNLSIVLNWLMADQEPAADQLRLEAPAAQAAE